MKRYFNVRKRNFNHVCEEDNLRYQDLGNSKMKSRFHESAKTQEQQPALLTLRSAGKVPWKLHNYTAFLVVNMTKF